MNKELKLAINLAEEYGVQKERQRIAQEFFDYPKRETLPLDTQAEIIKIITIDLNLNKKSPPNNS